LVETFLLLDLRTYFRSSTSQLSSFLPPSSWRSHFNFQRYPTDAKLFLSSLCRHCGTSLCQLLFSVAKVTYSLSVLLLWRTPRRLSSPLLFILLSSQRLNLLVSLVSPFLLRILPPAVGLPFQSTYKPCCSETGCPSSNTEFPTSTVHQSLFRPLSLSPQSPRSWVHISEPTNLNFYRRSRHLTCPLSSLVLAP